MRSTAATCEGSRARTDWGVVPTGCPQSLTVWYTGKSPSKQKLPAPAGTPWLAGEIIQNTSCRLWLRVRFPSFSEVHLQLSRFRLKFDSCIAMLKAMTRISFALASWLAFVIGFLLSLPFLFPAEFTVWSRRIRQWLREDLRRRVTPEQWEACKDAFEDL